MARSQPPAAARKSPPVVRRPAAAPAVVAKPAVVSPTIAKAIPKEFFPMNTAAFKFPFEAPDFTKLMGEFKLPMFNVEALVEGQRKTAAAFTAANQNAFETLKAISERQVAMAKAGFDEMSKVASDVMSAATPEEKATKQADAAKKAYETAIANAKEISDIVVKAQTSAFEALNTRVVESFDEVKTFVAKK
jgi:phasin family protein